MSERTSQLPIGGVLAALSTPLFLGVAPIFGKMAIQAGSDPFTVAALRTMVAVGLLWLVYLLFAKRYIFIYPAGLMGCVVIGAINGIGSLFYYGGLHQLDASLVQLINGLYLVFAVVIAHLSGQRASSRTVLRVLLAMVALALLTGFGAGGVNWIGVGFMLGSALMFAGTVTLSQYVLYEMPSPTAALYILTTMGVVVTMVWLAVSPTPIQDIPGVMTPIALLGLTTALSRLAMFAGVKFLGAMQTAIFAALEIVVALLLSALVLGEVLTTPQWIGAGLLLFTLLLTRQQDLLAHGFNPNYLVIANMASVQFQRIAFHRAFGTHETDNSEGTMGAITTQEMIAIQRMMGAEIGGIDPYPIGKTRQIIENPAFYFEETQPAAPPAFDPTAQTRPVSPNGTVQKQEFVLLEGEEDDTDTATQVQHERRDETSPQPPSAADEL